MRLVRELPVAEIVRIDPDIPFSPPLRPDAEPHGGSTLLAFAIGLDALRYLDVLAFARELLALTDRNVDEAEVSRLGTMLAEWAARKSGQATP